MLQFSSLPYPGLRPFRDYESDIFFGREEQTDELLARLDRCRFLAVTGASGCGKSSLVKAGMIPALNAGFMAAAGSRWAISEFRPGDRPLERLTQALARPEVLGVDRHGEEAAAFVEAALRRGPLGLIEVARGAETLQNANLLILVDQFEELFRNRERIDPDEADAFVALLLASAQQTAVAIYVVITMRSDYLGECAAFHGLPQAVSDSQYLTPRLTHEQLEEAIAGPARVFDGRVDERLVNRLINDFGSDPDQLPLLQHALARMWARRDTSSCSPLLTVEQYEAIGGDKALSTHGDEIYAELSAEQQRIAQIMFKRLSGTEDGRRDVRYSASVSEVAAIASDEPSKVLGEVIAVAEAFRRPDRCFLAVPDGPVEPPTLLDLSHESLIRQWHRLAAWVADEARSAEDYRRLRDWAVRHARREAQLWSGPDLASAITWQEREKPKPAWAERYRDVDQPQDQFELAKKFILASRRRHRMRWVQRLGLISGSAAASLAVGILIYEVGWVWERDTYYKDYVKEWGVPKGIEKLNTTEVHHRSRSYKITTAGVFGAVVRMEAVNAEGQTVSSMTEAKMAPVELGPAVSRSKYMYDGTRLLFEDFLDRSHQLIGGIFYYPSTSEDGGSRMAYVFGKNNALGTQTGSCAVRIQYDYSREGREILIHYFDRDGNPTPGTDNAYMKKRRYDNQGHITSEVSLDRYGDRINDQSGNSEMVVSYNSKGEIETFESLDLASRPIDLRDPDSGQWQKLTRNYDSFGHVVAESYWHEDGAPAEVVGCHSKKFSYDDRGKLIRGICLQSNGAPSEAGSAWKAVYDQDDNPIKYTFFDRDGHPSNEIGYIYDEEGNVVETAYFDAKHQPSNDFAGYHKEISVFKNGHPVRTEHLAEDGKRISGSPGLWAVKESSFDYCGREISVSLSDADGQHRALVRKTYDENNHVSEEACQGDGSSCTDYASGKLDYDGYVRVTRKFDGNGNVTKEDYFDSDNHPAKQKEGYTEINQRYDDHNRLLEKTSFQLTGESEKIAYNERGKEVEWQYLGADGKPILSKKGYARLTRRYDDRDMVVEEAYFGTSGEPVLTADGWARITYVNDERGRAVERAHFGVHSEPVVGTTETYHRATRHLDDQGNVLELSLFGTDGKPLGVEDRQNNRHCARFVFHYGADGQQTGSDCFDARGNSVAQATTE
jgi:hypothetical protein